MCCCFTTTTRSLFLGSEQLSCRLYRSQYLCRGALLDIAVCVVCDAFQEVIYHSFTMSADLQECTNQNLKLRAIVQEFPAKCAQQAREYYSTMHTAWDFVMSVVAFVAISMLVWQRYNVQIRMYWTRLKQQLFPEIKQEHTEECSHQHDEHVHETVRQRFKDAPEVE